MPDDPKTAVADAPAARSIPLITDGEREARCVPLSNVEVRRNEDGSVTVEGYAAVYESESEDLGGFVEELKQGAFRKVLQSKPDVRFLVNHEGVPLGRTAAANTLRLKDAPRGLNFACDFPDTQSARDLAVSIERGDITQCSFMFCVEPEGREWFFPDDAEEPARRVIYEVSELFDVSVVTFPAYSATEIGVRGVIAGEPIASPEGRLDQELFAGVCKRVHGGDLEVTRAERRELERAAERLDTLTPWHRERDKDAEAREISVEGEGDTGAAARVAAGEGKELRDGVWVDVSVVVADDDETEEEETAEESEASGRSVDLMRRRLTMREREFAALTS
jgi:Escherichia/Staphylococcus phage prohead protease